MNSKGGYIISVLAREKRSTGKLYGEDGSVAEVINHDGWNLVNGIYYYLEDGTGRLK